VYTALYREWRPKVFEDLIGQQYIVKILRNQIITGRIAHAYLFCGTRGTGKTSTAKILSRAVNCTSPNGGDPCGVCEICEEINAGKLIDIVEIDAASNNRVENIRDLIEDVKYPPHRARYKVYIIDEVHMLSISAFNALLKTLEEPPHHVIFILATTDPQKVPPTILSRCQRFDFRRIKSEDVFVRLRRIVDDNGVFVEDKTLKAISRLCDGAMRDALSVLDQCMSINNGKIDYEDVVLMLGITSNEHILNLIDNMIEKDIEGAINEIEEVIYNGKDIIQFVKEIIKHFRNLLMIKISKKPQEIIDVSEETISSLREQAKKIRSEELMRGINIFVDAENDCKTISQPRIRLELAIIKFCRREYDTSSEMILSRISSLEERIKAGEFNLVNKEAKKILSPTADKVNLVSEEVKNDDIVRSETFFTPDIKYSVTMDEVKAVWQEVIDNLNANKNKVVSMLLSQGKIQKIEGHVITIEFNQSYSINKKILDQLEKKKIAEESFDKLLNKSIKLNFVLEHNEISAIDQSIEKMRAFVGEDIIEVIEK
jgi:DNA polymerase III subunit gamma/tau